LIGLGPGINEITTYGKDPSHLGGEFVKGSSSTFSGRTGGFRKSNTPEQATSIRKTTHFHTGGRQKSLPLRLPAFFIARI
jgi:hypothetical protein